MIFLALRDACSAPQIGLLGLEATPRHCGGYMQPVWVCRAWRSVALKYAPLWSRISVSAGARGLARVAMFLEHSGQSALAVECPYKFTDSVKSDILRNAYRLRRLRLEGELDPEHMALLTTQDAPLLNALDLHSPPAQPEDELPTLFNGVHPRLTALALAGYTHYGQNSFTGVKDLHLARQRYASVGDFDRLLDFLDRDRKSTRLNSSHSGESRMPSSA